MTQPTAQPTTIQNNEEIQPLIHRNPSLSSDPHSQNSDFNGRSSDPQSQKPRSCCLCCQQFLLYCFTHWPLETIKQVTEPGSTNEPQECSSSLALGLQFISVIRLFLIICALFVQYMSCFRRDCTNRTLKMVPVENKTGYHNITCDDMVDFIRGFLIPDIIIVLLAIWVYIGLGSGIIQWCCNYCGWKELSAVMLADEAKKLNKLVEEAQEELKKRNVKITYTLIPTFYIILSLAISVSSLVVELNSLSPSQSLKKIYNGHLIIKPPQFSNSIDRSTCKVLTKVSIPFSLLGFIFLDLLYLQVLLRYAYRCQLIIYYLEILEKRITLQDLMRELEVMTENAYTFIKDLNTSSLTIAFLVLISGFQAVNCAVSLLSENINVWQVPTIMARLVLWGFLLVFPFYKAAGINSIYQQLQHLGWEIKRQSFLNNDDSVPILLKAKIIGIPLHPWFPYLLVFTLLFTIMAGLKVESILELVK